MNAITVTRSWFLLCIVVSTAYICPVDSRPRQKVTDHFSAVGTDDFYDLVVNDGAFVDKSLLIDKYLRIKDDLLLLTRPRRFGKTINGDMIVRFLRMNDCLGPKRSADEKTDEDDCKLFAGGTVRTKSGEMKTLQPLKISYSDFSLKHQGRWPVLHVRFNAIAGSNFEWIQDSFAKYIGQLFDRYGYLRSSSGSDDKYDAYRSGNASGELLENGLNFLIGRLSAHWNRTVHLIVDDYDTPLLMLLSGLMDTKDGNCNLQLLQESVNSVDFRNTANFVRALLANALRRRTAERTTTTVPLEKALISGTLPIDHIVGGIGLKNVGSSFGDFYGFSQSEVDVLVSTTDLDGRDRSLYAWYGGYNNMGKVNFNAYSVPKLLQQLDRSNATYGGYMFNLTNGKIIGQLLSVDEIQLEISKTVNESAISSQLDNMPVKLDDTRQKTVYHMLLFFGYLTPIKCYADNDVEGQLRLPNEEIRLTIKESVIKWASRTFGITEDRIREMGQMLLEGKEVEFEQAAKESFISKKIIRK